MIRQLTDSQSQLTCAYEFFCKEHANEIAILLSPSNEFADREIMCLDTPTRRVICIVVADLDCATLPSCWQHRSLEPYAMHIEAVCEVKGRQFALSSRQ